MALHSSDRLLWLCLGTVHIPGSCILQRDSGANLPQGVTLFFAVRGIAAELYHVQELTEIRNGDKDDQVIGEGTEDGKYDLSPFFNTIASSLTLIPALKLETLQKLSESTSFDLRAAYGTDDIFVRCNC